MEAKRLDYSCGLLLKLVRHRLKGVGSEELSRSFELAYLIVAFFDIRYAYIVYALIFFTYSIDYVVTGLALKELDYVVRNLVNNVYRARADIENYIVSAKLVLMYYGLILSKITKKSRL